MLTGSGSAYPTLPLTNKPSLHAQSHPHHIKWVGRNLYLSSCGTDSFGNEPGHSKVLHDLLFKSNSLWLISGRKPKWKDWLNIFGFSILSLLSISNFNTSANSEVRGRCTDPSTKALLEPQTKHSRGFVASDERGWHHVLEVESSRV